MSEYGSTEKLRREHLLDHFDFGKEELNRFLKRQAWASQQSHGALLVHAKDDAANNFYERFDFEPSLSDPYHLLLIMKDLLRMTGR